jgi:membrane protein
MRRVRQIAAGFVEHSLITYAAAIAFQNLIALVSLSILTLGILGATGHESVWTDHVAPTIQEPVRGPVFRAIDYSARRILENGTAGVIAVGAVLSVWYLTAAMRAVIEALDQIHEVKDRRAWRERVATAVLLGVLGGACLFGGALMGLAGGPVGWLAALVLGCLAVTLILRFAPAQQPGTKWATIGGGAIVIGWAVASALFWLWIAYVANFRSPVGTMTTLLVLTSYLFVSAVVFLAGAQFDELLRTKA